MFKATIIIIGGLLFVLLLKLAEWSLLSYDINQRIKFNNFTNLYAINPNRWRLDDGYVKFIKPSRNMCWHETIYFKFHFIDFCRYQHWKNTIDKQKQKEKDCKELQEVISILKSDLEKFENKNAKNMNAAAKHTIELCGKIKGKNITAQDIQEYLKQAGYNVVTNPGKMYPGPKTRREMEIKGMVDKLWDI